MRPPGCLRLVPGWGVPGGAAPLSLPAPAVWHYVSNRVWGIAMETRQAQEGPHSPLQPPSRGLFLASVYLNRGCRGWAVGRGWTGTSKEAIGQV